MANIKKALKALGVIRPPQKKKVRVRRVPPKKPQMNLKYSNVDKNIALQEFLRMKKQQEFEQFVKSRQMSYNTQRILQRVATIQNKGKKDNEEMQRRLRERKILEGSMNLMKAHENMQNVNMDFTGVSDDNILKAPNTFKENPENNILRTNKLNILQTKEGGNQLQF